MASYYASLALSSRAVFRVFTYDAANKRLVSVNDRVEFEEGADYFAVKVDDDYSLVYDADGLLVGDFQKGTPEQYPRLDFFEETSGIKQRMASLTADGRLTVAAVTEADPPAEGLAIGYGGVAKVVFTPAGVTAAALNEVWFLTHNGDYVTDGGLLIRVRTAVEA